MIGERRDAKDYVPSLFYTQTYCWWHKIEVSWQMFGIYRSTWLLFMCWHWMTLLARTAVPVLTAQIFPYMIKLFTSRSLHNAYTSNSQSHKPYCTKNMGDLSQIFISKHLKYILNCDIKLLIGDKMMLPALILIRSAVLQTLIFSNFQAHETCASVKNGWLEPDFHVHYDIWICDMKFPIADNMRCFKRIDTTSRSSDTHISKFSGF